MSRSQFVETVVRPYGSGSTLIPVGGVQVAAYAVNDDGTEGDLATTYLDRIDSTAGPDSTDASGTVAFYLEPGDYNIHFDDPQDPPRIDSFVRGFAAVTARSLELERFAPGDLKLSIATDDHGDSTGVSGVFDWLRLDGGVDGNGRLVSASQYSKLWVILGAPTPDGGGNFRLPNPSARALIAAGQAAGLTTRDLLAMSGTEKDSRQFAIPSFALTHAGLPVAGKVSLVDHYHPVSEIYAKVGHAVSGTNIFKYSNVDATIATFDAGTITVQGTPVSYDATAVTWKSTPVSGNTDAVAGLASDPTDFTMNLTGGVTDALDLVVPDIETVPQDVDKMQPWIAFTVFVRAT